MTSQPEKFSLNWNEVHEKRFRSYQELRQQPDFSDVTLVCEEDQSIEAHRIILMAYSPGFLNLLRKTKHSHPVIYMRRLEAKDLVAILYLFYHGEANIYQKDLEVFLALA